jgi:membrane-associated protein
VARWLPWVRTLAPMIAGAAGMNNRRFILANTIGAVVWVPTLIMLGYYGAGLLHEVPWLTQVALIVTIGFFVLGTGYGLFRYRQEMRKPVDTDEFVPEAPTPQG